MYIIDTDGAMDDLVAIALLLRDHVNIQLITTVKGMYSAEDAAANVYALLTHYHATHIPIAIGLNSNDAITTSTHIPFVPIPVHIRNAVSRLILKVEHRHHPITLICLGPLTNVASAIQIDPSFASNVKEIIMFSGSFQNVSEFNADSDPRAFDIVQHAAFPRISIIPIEEQQTIPTSKISITDPWIQSLIRDSNGSAIAYDPLVAFYMEHPDAFTQHPYKQFNIVMNVNQYRYIQYLNTNMTTQPISSYLIFILCVCIFAIVSKRVMMKCSHS